MRVLIATSFPIPGEFDGTAMLPIKIMRALKSRGVEVALCYLKARPPWGRGEESEFEGVPLYTFAPHDWVTGLKRLRKRHPFDVVHAQHYGGATRAYAACRLFRWPLVYEIHSLLGDEVERDRLGRGLKFHAYLELEKRVLRRAAHVIALGEPVREVVIKEKGVPAARVSVIYPGIDISEFDRVSEPARVPGISENQRIIMYIGSIVHPNQGVPLLIDALPRVFRTHSDAVCVLVGGPAEAGEAYRASLGSDGGRLIVLTGKMPDEVVALARRADVLVHPRLACRENYSVQSKLAVYLAASKPIVATDFGDYRTLLGETGAGLLTEVDSTSIAEGISRVLSDRNLAESLSRAAAPVAREYFGMDRNVDRYLAVYDRAIADGPR